MWNTSRRGPLTQVDKEDDAMTVSARQLPLQNALTKRSVLHAMLRRVLSRRLPVVKRTEYTQRQVHIFHASHRIDQKGASEPQVNPLHNVRRRKGDTDLSRAAQGS